MPAAAERRVSSTSSRKAATSATRADGIEQLMAATTPPLGVEHRNGDAVEPFGVLAGVLGVPALARSLQHLQEFRE
ncbi:hypothetical protein QFZ21_002610 [Microbacterium sp. W4I20]|nr:hypothetical protein [Microbacterium sp. W4I20]